MVAIDMVGKRFGRLVVVEQAPHKWNRRVWLCQCDCGERRVVDGANLRGGRQMSCGCLLREKMAEIGRASRKHGQAVAETSEYKAWSSMKARCHNPSHKQYSAYGGRGIAVAPEWREDFQAFFEHVGKRPSRAHSLDRINNSRGYEPGNVRWATQVEQTNNTRKNHLVWVGGERMTLAEAIRLKGQRSNVVRQRLAFGWSMDRALNEPITPRSSRGISRKKCAPESP